MVLFMQVINMLLRQLLIQYEIDHDLSHEDMIQKIGIGRSTYFRWLNGESTKLKKTTLKKLSDVLECDVESMIADTYKVKPILGQAKAGYDLPAEENIEGYIEVNSSDSKKGDYFLRVSGDSMEGSHIFDGDLIYIEKCDCVSDGQIAVVLIGDEATIKKVRFKNGLIILEASNPKYESRYFSAEEIESLPVRIIGRVRFVRTDFD